MDAHAEDVPAELALAVLLDAELRELESLGLVQLDLIRRRVRRRRGVVHDERLERDCLCLPQASS